VSLAGQERLREAVKEFRETLTFIPKFRDAKELADKYEKIANEQDAKTHYERGMSLMNQYKFKEAEAEFSKVNEYVRGYKDALQLQTRCKEAIPNDKQIILAIARCLQSEIPVSWVGNLLGGRNARVSTVRVQKIGIYNERYGYWPMKIRVAGTCALNDPFNQGKTVRFDRVSDFLLYRDDYGEWQARLRGGMFQ